jgi:tRNA-dihydrouridine synthase
MRISSGPLQGLTDAIFRKTHQEVWGGIDEYYGPYLRLDSHKDAKASQIRDIESPLNKSHTYIPQLMGNDPLLIMERMLWLKDLGFHHVNWNLGCPYPMVTKRNMGAGLLNQPELIREILEQIIPQSPLSFSIKCRLGLSDEQEIFPLIDVFNQFDLNEIIIHARTATQMYKGKAKPTSIPAIIEKSKNPIAYNGDIHSMEKFQEIQEIVDGKIEHIMLGRGLLMKPYLAAQIKGNLSSNEDIKKKMLDFHNRLLEQYGERLQDHQLLMKMRTFWEYFSQSFSNPHKAYKLIKKASNMKKYDLAIHQIFLSFGDFKY